jgi:hypothetical protein
VFPYPPAKTTAFAHAAAQRGRQAVHSGAASADLQYWRKELGNLRPDCREERLVATYRIGNIRFSMHRKSRPQHGKILDALRVSLGRESRRFAQREGPPELPGGKRQDAVTVCFRHREDKVGIRRHPLAEAPCSEVGCVTSELLEDTRSERLYRMPRQRVRAGT